MKQFKLFAFVVLALAVGLLAGRIGQGNSPALIDTFDGAARLFVLLLLGLLLYGSLALAARRVVRYHQAGDPRPEQIHFVDRATANRWKGSAGAEPVDQAEPPASVQPVRRTKW